jgi:hypothetical protein
VPATAKQPAKRQWFCTGFWEISTWDVDFNQHWFLSVIRISGFFGLFNSEKRPFFSTLQ